MKPSQRPSGDHAGSELVPLELVSWMSSPVRVFTNQICVSYRFSVQFACWTLKATKRPSGEMLGVEGTLRSINSSIVGACLSEARAGCISEARANKLANKIEARADLQVSIAFPFNCSKSGSDRDCP